MRESILAKLSLWRERFRGSILFASGMLAVLLALFFYNLLFPRDQISKRDVEQAVAVAMASAVPQPSDAAHVYEIIQPSVVLIETAFDGKDGQAGSGIGAGVIIDDSADIVTSLHVVRGSSDIQITFADGSKSSAFILDQNEEQDLAILRAFNTPDSIVPATLGDPGAMRVGDDVFLVGNPYGLYGSMSAGVISGFDRSFQPTDADLKLDGLIQFDAAANPGNLGGPLLDENGRVIGIVTGVLNPGDGNFFVGIGFAVPINIAASGGSGSPPY